MSDIASLRLLLQRVDGSDASIKAAANGMMKHYDRSAALAVNEWRNCLQSAKSHQMLSLLYVVNEVLFVSKRNRGSKFLEALSPVLGPSLQFICQGEPSSVEKIRRVIKIWGDRRIFSIRFVQELLRGLEPYRKQNQQQQHKKEEEAAQFSPVHTGASHDDSERSDSQKSGDSHRHETTRDEIEDLMNDDQDKTGFSDEDDDEDVFGELSQSQRLDVEIKLDEVALQKQPASPTFKRRRSSAASMNSQSSSKRRRKSAVLSNSNLLDLWIRLEALEQSFGHAQMTLAKIGTACHKTPAAQLEHLVGDELSQHVVQTQQFQQQLAAQRASLHAIAQERYALQQQALRYLPWLEKALQQDVDDVEFCHVLTSKLRSFSKIHAAICKARDERRAEDARQQAQEQAQLQAQKEAEENEKFRQAAFKKETEAKPGMVWNPVTREYQNLDTEESWRD